MVGNVLTDMELVEVGDHYALLFTKKSYHRTFMAKRNHADVVARIVSEYAGRRLEVFVDPGVDGLPPEGGEVSWGTSLSDSSPLP